MVPWKRRFRVDAQRGEVPSAAESAPGDLRPACGVDDGGPSAAWREECHDCPRKTIGKYHRKSKHGGLMVVVHAIFLMGFTIW